MNTTAYPTNPDERTERVTEEWLLQHGADYSQPWGASEEEMEKGPKPGSLAQRKAWWERSQRVLLRNPLVPLNLRMIVLTFSLIALGLGVKTLKSIPEENQTLAQSTSPIMAIVVDAIAPIYLLWVTYDEYTGKPLGLRSPKSKMRLIFCDLFFVVADSANLSLAFDSARETDTGTQWPLAGVLLVALIAWLMTFSVSVLR